jgi:hypothetical protein
VIEENHKHHTYNFVSVKEFTAYHAVSEQDDRHTAQYLFICDLTQYVTDYIASNDRMINDLERMRKEARIA